MRRANPLILGAGPAGCAAAIALGGAATLIERTRETGDALCGGFLSWRSLDALARLGIDPGGVPVERVRLFAGDRTAEAALPHTAMGVSRRQLDTRMQARAVRVGAGLERGVAVREVAGGSVRLADGTSLAAPAVFLATGKHDLRGVSRGTLAADPTLGLRVRLANAPALRQVVGGAIELHLFRGGYAGLVMQEDGANLCLAVRRSRLRAEGDPERLLAAIAREVPPLADRLAHRCQSQVDAIANVPYGWRARHSAAGLFRLGDQAAVIPSLAGEGMGIAVASGVLAAQAWHMGGATAAPDWQAGFAARVRAPLGRARLLRDLAERPMAAQLLIGLTRLAPAAARIAAAWTRIEPLDAIDPAPQM